MTTLDRRDEEGRRSAADRPGSVGVLADRMAAALVHHEPGWRLPRLTALARRYNVSAPEVDAAIDELAARHLVRRLPDGQVYRASPAEYLVPLEGVPGLASQVDPMGGLLECKNRHASRRRPPEDIGRSLGLAAGELAVTVRCLWTVGGEPAALSASYLPERLAAALGDLPLAAGPEGDAEAGEDTGTPSASYPPERLAAALGDLPLAAGPEGDAEAGEDTGTPFDSDAALVPGEDTLPVPADGPPGREVGIPADGRMPEPGTDVDPPSLLFPWQPSAAGAAQPRALQIELGLPPPSVARSLRLAAGEPVVTVTANFTDPVLAPRWP